MGGSVILELLAMAAMVAMAVMVEWEDMVAMAVMGEWEDMVAMAVMVKWEDMVAMAVMAEWEAQVVGRIVTVTITLLKASKHMVHLSMVMVSIPIMVNLMASIIRTTTLLRVTRNNLTIENHILANLNKVNILTLTSPSVSLTEELSPSMTSTLSHSMTLTEVLSLNKINILIPAIL